MDKPILFRTRPTEKWAIQWTGENDAAIAEFLLPKKFDVRDCPGESLFIETLEGAMRADKGDWIVKGLEGEFYPVKPRIFAATYEAV